jgi:predicted Zn-dependent protease
LLDSNAALTLSDEALRLHLGHEVAHIAKRHNSKQLQQRLIDIGVAQQMVEKLSKRATPNDIVALVGDQNVFKKFGGNFAAYQRSQELQADACAIRELVRAGLDPQKARDDYLFARGSDAKAGATQGESALTVWMGDFSTHPNDPTRNAFFAEATRHHQQALAAR